MNIPVNLDSVNSVPETQKEMLSVVNDGHRSLVRVNSSSLSILQECWRKSNYNLNLGLRSNRESEATLFGSAIHAAMEVFYSAPKVDRVLPKNHREKMLLLSGPEITDPQELIYRAGKAFVNRAQELASLPNDNARSIINGLWILSHYFQEYINDPYETLTDENGVPYVERSFTIPLHSDDNINIDYFGKIDLIIKNPLTNQILVADHKTTTRVGADFFKRISPNFQYTGYILGARESLKLDVDTFLVNGIEVKRQPVTNRGSPPNFPRQITKRGNEDFIEFKSAVKYYVEQYLLMIKSGIWPMGTTNSCTMYSGCQYHEICSSSNQIRENIIKSNYTQR